MTRDQSGVKDQVTATKLDVTRDQCGVKDEVSKPCAVPTNSSKN